MPICVSPAARVLIATTLGAALACSPSRSTEMAPAPAVDVADTATRVEGNSIEAMFAGRFPGVTVSRTDGGGLQIRIRGGSNTFYGSDEPLYVLDGTPLPGGTGGIVYVNPYDIERIEVLKNPADVAIYGIRGGNGVVRITTKRPRRP